MVFTYIGIVRVLWGSLPTERLSNDEKRALHINQHKIPGFTFLIILKKEILSLCFSFV